jgi:hypothetical protein
VEAIGDPDLITLLIAFGRQKCRSVNWTATHVNKRNFFKAPTSNVDDAGTIIAQIALAGRQLQHDAHTWMFLPRH